MQEIINKQIEVEQHYERMKDRELNPDMTMEEAFGPLEEWILQVGRIQYWLNPLNGTWYYLDPIHETWEHSGYQAGEAFFTLLDEGEEQPLRIYTAPIESAADEVANRCPSCQAEVDPDQKFCTSCGQKL